jgi:hypothetical protein
MRGADTSLAFDARSGAAPGNAHGADVAADGTGTGTVVGRRLCPLLRQFGEVADHTFPTEFLDPGVRAYAFTFG